MEGARYNKGKTRWGLLSWPALGELVKVLEFGAQKYDSWNWSKGLSWTETFESLQRHAIAWYSGEDRDPETGLSHVAHVFCNAMFLMHFILFRTGKDDRPSALRATKGEVKKDAGYSNPMVERRVSDVQENLQQKDAYEFKRTEFGDLYRDGKPFIGY